MKYKPACPRQKVLRDRNKPRYLEEMKRSLMSKYLFIDHYLQLGVIFVIDKQDWSEPISGTMQGDVTLPCKCWFSFSTKLVH